MKCGVFLPNGSNGYIISKASPTYVPTYAHNREITLEAERQDLNFVLSMMKYRGFGGEVVASVVEALQGRRPFSVRRLAAPRVPVSYAPPLEARVRVSKQAVAEAAADMVEAASAAGSKR